MRTAELRRHADPGFDRDDLGAPGLQQSGRDTGTGPDVGDPRTREGPAGELFDGVEEGGG